MKMKVKGPGSLFKTHPNLTLLVILIAGAALGIWLVRQTWAQEPISSSNIFTSYSVIATVAGIAGAFSGVTLTFGLGGTGSGFRIFRSKGGATLTSNWLSLVWSSFASSGLALLAILLFSFKLYSVAFILAVLAMFVLLNLLVRTVWLINIMVKVVQGDDILAAASEDKIKYGNFPKGKE